jgi:hypothetical protein
MRGAMLPLPNTRSWRGAQPNHRDNFSFIVIVVVVVVVVIVVVVVVVVVVIIIIIIISSAYTRSENVTQCKW